MDKIIKKKQRSALKLTTTKLTMSAWITNFWIINQDVFLTDSQFKIGSMVLAKLGLPDLLVNLTKKGPLNPDFLQHPHPLKNSFLVASKTSIEPLLYFDDFLYSLIFYKDCFYLSFIKNDRSGSYVACYDQNWTLLSEKLVGDQVVVGSFDNELLVKDFWTKTTTFLDQQVSFMIPATRQIVETSAFYVVSTDDNQLFKIDKVHQVVTLLKVFDDEITIGAFDQTSFLLSIKDEETTYYVNHLEDKEPLFNVLTKQYFYRLATFQKQLLVGKPLFLTSSIVDYDQPLVFIK